MKVAVASDDGQTVASHLGKVRGFVICRVENGYIIDREYRINSFTGHARAAAGMARAANRHGPILEALADCAVVVSGGMGQRIRDDLAQSGIDVIVTDEGNVDEAVHRLIIGALADRTGPGCDHHYGEGDKCGT
ncbi:MAG: NifB/NifX family molybdenum-iron cluster-binding protein [Candidatus Zixiibacteriota bacterium]